MANNKLNNFDQISELDFAKEVLRIEYRAVKALVDRIDDEFSKAVSLLYDCKGRVIVSGVGKSGVVGRKISATLCSTGTPAVFLHSADGLHGDLGMVTSGDVMIWISKSGNSEEFKDSFPLLKRIGVNIIAISGNMDSFLAMHSDVTLDVSVKEEACPNDLAPTASTTATIAMGDALAVSVLKRRNFTREDFAYLHPGGSLGKQLLLMIDDVMTKGEDIPTVKSTDNFRKVLVEMNQKRFGGTCVLDEENKLVGIFTDGDLKRLLESGAKYDDLTAADVMTKNPKTTKMGSLAAHSMHIMKKYDIMQIIIIDDENKPVGIIHLHDLLNEGLY